MHQPGVSLAGMAVRGEECNEQVANEFADIKCDGAHEPEFCRLKEGSKRHVSGPT